MARWGGGNNVELLGELLAKAAESLGLPRGATPEDIAIATSQRPYPPPAVQ